MSVCADCALALCVSCTPVGVLVGVCLPCVYVFQTIQMYLMLLSTTKKSQNCKARLKNISEKFTYMKFFLNSNHSGQNNWPFNHY